MKKFSSEEEINSQLRDLTAEMRRLRREFLDRSRPGTRRRERLIARESSSSESTSSQEG